MAGRKSPPLDDEKKSYGALWLVMALLLFLGGLWAIADDNLFRRPWKPYQAGFSRLEIARTKEAIRAEEERLAQLPEYQAATKQRAEAEAALAGGEITQIEGELARERQIDLEKDLNVRFVKSELEELRFQYDDAKHHGHPTDEILATIRGKEALLVERQKVYAASQAKIASLENRLKELRGGVKTAQDAIDALATSRADLEQKLEAISLGKFFGPTETPPYLGVDWQPPIPKIRQVVLEEFDRNRFNNPVARVDRCMSCHAGIDKAGFDDQENPWKTHPQRDLLLGKHPVDKFGCTPCHNGQGEAVNGPEKAHGNFYDEHGHLENVEFIEHPLLRREKMQANCIHCHESVQNLEGAEYIARGEKLFVELGCHGCHLVQGYDALAKHKGVSQIGPSLRRIAAKADPAWMVRWIRDPQAFRTRTRMPYFYFDETQAMQATAYLLSVSAEPAAEWLAANPEPDLAGASAERGQDLVGALGCRACHGLAEDERAGALSETKDVAPNLARIAEKTSARWLYGWIRDPRGFSHVARMPSLRLSEAEAADVTAYLATLGRREPGPAGLVEQLADPANVQAGLKLVRRYGCPGCHEIPGLENESRVSVELSTFGDKTKEELFFGDRTDLHETWDDWTYGKLENPRTYATKWIEQAMPDFRLAPDEIKAVRTFLTSRTERRAPRALHYGSEFEHAIVRGRQLVARYNCTGCHLIEGRGGDVRRLPAYEESPNLAPPNLNTEGRKVQSAWLFNFLKKPVPIRPWLRIRMPSFGLDDDETTELVSYFHGLDEVTVPYVHLERAAFHPASVRAGELLASDDYLACWSCHQRGAVKPQGPPEGWAPDLTMAAQRLNPEWIVDWIRDPQAIMPGTKMPSFYPDPKATDGPPDVLDGDDEAQMRALRDYIMTLGLPVAPAPGPAQAAHVAAGGAGAGE